MKRYLPYCMAIAMAMSGKVCAQTIIGLTTDNKVFSMANPAMPGVVSTPVAVTGITAGQTIAGMDFRPNTGELFLLGYDPSNGNAQLYKLNYSTAVATVVNSTPVTLNLGTGSIGFDFNPTVDRIRVVGANKKNYRLNPITGAIAATDADLAYAAGDPNAAATPSIGACAYTNSYIGSEATTLYNYDESLNILTIQNPPNNGTQNTVGSSGITVSSTNRTIDMDIYFSPATRTNTAYMTANTTGNNDDLYQLNLTTGTVSSLGLIGTGLDVKDIAVVIDRTVPAAVSGQLVYGLTKVNGYLFSFDSDNPSLIRSLAPVTGITAGQQLVGMDVRPANRKLYALGYNASAKLSQLYTIDPVTAVATPVNTTAVTINLDSARLIGFDFNPMADRIRIVNANGRNYRLNPNDGTVAGTDVNLAYAAGDINAGIAPRVATVAYTNSFAGTASTVLYALDDSLKAFANITPPNNGTINTIAGNVVDINPADRTTDMDFYFDSTAGINRGYLVANTGSSVNDNFYLLNTSGSVSLAGTVGYGVQVADIAVQADYTGAQAMVASQSMIGITEDDKVFMFNAAMPGTITTPMAITGLPAGMSVAGADYRPNTGELYILGYNSGNGNAQLFTLNAATGAANAVNATPVTLNLGTGSIGFDFNPTVDRIRVVGANKKNYRLHPVTGAIAATDADLAYAATDVNAAATPSVGACAYTNSYIGSEATTLYDFDELLNILAIQNPPNNGTLNTVGNSGIIINPAGRTVDMDIAFNPANSLNTAFLAANTGAGINDTLYSINLYTGAAAKLGTIGNGLAVKDIAAVIDRTVPANITGQMVYALTKNNGNLISFDSDNPELVRTIAPVTGLTAGQQLAGMDFRPADRMLYALGYNAAAKNYQLYTINTATGAATAINTTPAAMDLDSAVLIGFDFNPVADLIRVVNANGKNYRLNPTTGAVAGTDGMLAYAAGDPNTGTMPRVASVAYTNSYKGTTATALYGIDDALRSFVNINPPNNGTLMTVQNQFLPVSMADMTTDIDFYYDSVTSSNMGYMAANINTSVNDNFYRINTSGMVTPAGRIGNGVPVADIAVKLTYTGVSTGISPVTAAGHTITLYPNPATAQVYIQPSRKISGGIVVELTDLAGRSLGTITAAGAAELAYPLEGIAPGVYLVHVSYEGRKESFKLVKQ